MNINFTTDQTSPELIELGKLSMETKKEIENKRIQSDAKIKLEGYVLKQQKLEKQQELETLRIENDAKKTATEFEAKKLELQQQQELETSRIENDATKITNEFEAKKLELKKEQDLETLRITKDAELKETLAKIEEELNKHMKEIEINHEYRMYQLKLEKQKSEQRFKMFKTLIIATTTTTIATKFIQSNENIEKHRTEYQN